MFSGAGKTVSAKYIMRYFATADGNDSDQVKAKAEGSGMTEVEEQILGRQTPPRLVHIETKPYIDFFAKLPTLSWRPLVTLKQLETITHPDLENTLRYLKRHRNITLNLANINVFSRSNSMSRLILSVPRSEHTYWNVPD